MTFLSHLECARCKKTYDADQVINLCTCGGPLLVRYALKAAAAQVQPERLTGRVSSLWRYRELLPVRRDDHVVTLGEGMTPLLPLRRLGAELGIPGLMLKDEGVNPTGTFTLRAHTCCSPATAPVRWPRSHTSAYVRPIQLWRTRLTGPRAYRWLP